LAEEEIHLDRIRTYSLKERKSKVSIKDFSRPHSKGASFGSFLKGLPNILAAQNLKNIATAICMARKKGNPVMFAMGAHVIKTGISPIIIDLIEGGFISSIATNGAGLVHDFEIALVGHTSEDVDVHLKNGRFGMAEETGHFINEAIIEGANKEWGLGEAFGKMLLQSSPPYENLSIAAAAQKNEVPFTVHVAIGTDIFHMHPLADGAALGKTSHRDFLRFCSLVAHLEGGVYLNIGSAVVLPEVFLKALTLTRNLGYPLRHFTTVDMDFINQYRPSKNVVERPTAGEGRGYQLTGHHEILIPLLAAAIKEGFD
jgi:hypothetical protein